MKTTYRDSIGSRNYEFLKYLLIIKDLIKSVIFVDLLILAKQRNLDFLEKFEKNHDFSRILGVSDIREFFAKRKI